MAYYVYPVSQPCMLYPVGGESTKVFSTKSYISLIRESFLPRKFPAVRYAFNIRNALYV